MKNATCPFESEPSNTQHRVLLVDDSVHYAENVYEILTDRGFPTDVAHSFSEGLEILQPNTHAIALIDLATWPPRNVKEQRRAEIRARARAYSTSGL